MKEEISNRQNRFDALKVLSIAQEQCASITVQIGGTDDNTIVENDTLYVIDCPPFAVTRLVEAGFTLGMQNHKLSVSWFNRKP